MKKHILYFLLSGYFFNTVAQDNIRNANKYWYYRQRLKDHFVEVDPNRGLGSNYPVDGLKWNSSKDALKYNIINWGDGNAGLQFYISMLATEYKLLKNNGLDYTETRNELFYALETFNRLDYTAETYFTYSNGDKASPNLNGFFIRRETVGIKGMAFEASSCTGGRPPEESKDNVWHYLPALALVEALLQDDNTSYYSYYENQNTTLSEMAMRIAYRIVSFMHDEGFFNDKWFIRNPVTSNVVQDCGGADDSGVIDELPYVLSGFVCGFQYGFAEAGHWISGRDLHFDDSEDDEGCFNSAAIGAVLIGKNFDNYCNLYTVMGGHTNYLINAKEAGYLYYYPQFVLIDYLLHGNTIKIDHPWFIQEYQNLLNSAPDCGPRNVRIPDDDVAPGDYSFNWSSSNALVWPDNKGDDKHSQKYNGLDYMLLHNLFWLVYGDCIYSTSSYSTAYSEAYAAQRSFDIVSLSSPTTKDENVTAKKVIFLKPGFSTKTGSNFTASITGSGIFNDTKLVYSKESSPLTLTSTCASIPLRKARATVYEKSDTNAYIPDSISALNQEIAETDVPQDFYVLPNPTNGKLFIGFGKETNFKVSLSDVMGRNLYFKEYGSKNFETIDVTDYEQGIYFMKVSWGNYVKTIKLVKQ